MTSAKGVATIVLMDFMMMFLEESAVVVSGASKRAEMSETRRSRELNHADTPHLHVCDGAWRHIAGTPPMAVAVPLSGEGRSVRLQALVQNEFREGWRVRRWPHGASRFKVFNGERDGFHWPVVQRCENVECGGQCQFSTIGNKRRERPAASRWHLRRRRLTFSLWGLVTTTALRNGSSHRFRRT